MLSILWSRLFLCFVVAGLSNVVFFFAVTGACPARCVGSPSL